jgi:hypothetical protein
VTDTLASLKLPGSSITLRRASLEDLPAIVGLLIDDPLGSRSRGLEAAMFQWAIEEAPPWVRCSPAHNRQRLVPTRTASTNVSHSHEGYKRRRLMEAVDPADIAVPSLHCVPGYATSRGLQLCRVGHRMPP